MNPVPEGDSRRTSSGLTTRQGLAWARVALAAVAVHLAGVVLAVVLVPVYAILAGGASAGGFAGLVSTASLPVLTLPAAAWAARAARPRSSLVVGLAVGLLVAGLLGVLFFWPYDPRSVALFALIVAAGPAGGLVGGATFPLRR